MLVLGGLPAHPGNRPLQNKIGFLYEIPILSQLLGGHTADLERTELLFFIPAAHHSAREGHARHSQGHQFDVQQGADRGLPEGPQQPHEDKAKNFLDRFKGD